MTKKFDKKVLLSKLKIMRKNKYVTLLVFPAILFFSLFYMMQPHYTGRFSDTFYTDTGDGFQNVWNIWWVNESIVDKGISPYFTTALHYPHGTTLLPQTMNIYNGLVGIPLKHVFGFSLVEVTNFAIVFSFVAGGVTMFFYIRYLLNRQNKKHKYYWISLLGGALFTFSSYHFAHAQGHMQLVSLQWMPLFLLCFWKLADNPSYKRALFSALSLLLVLSCDYYYFIWCVMVGGLYVLWKVYAKELKITRSATYPFVLFSGIILLTAGPMIYNLLHLNKVDPLLGFHDAKLFSLDPLSVITPGGSSYWASLTQSYWTRLSYFSETSNYFGLLTIACVVIAAIKWKKLKQPKQIVFWWIVMIVFGLLSLGPRLTTLHHTLDSVPLPYAFLEHLIPSFKLSGMPIRWLMVAHIGAIVITCFVLTKIKIKSSRMMQYTGVAIALFCFVELYPAQLPATSHVAQDYVYALRDLPDGAVVDNAALTGGEQLYNQTIHEKPMGFGYVTRLPESVEKKDFFIWAALEEGRYKDLCSQFNVRYLTLPAERKTKYEVNSVYNDGVSIIYDFFSDNRYCGKE